MGQESLWYRIGRALGNAARPVRASRPKAGRGGPGPRGEREHARAPRTASGDAYPGDFTGPLTISYAPNQDDRPDPGEVVWTWVPYEEDHTQGKDRPVLIVGRDARWLLGVPLSSKDHDLDAAQEAGEGRYWVEIGRGAWDGSGRESAVRVNRIVRVEPNGVRRIGARLDEARFRVVAEAIRQHAG